MSRAAGRNFWPKLVIVYIVAVLVPAIFLAGLFYQKSISIAQDEFVTNMNLTLGQVASNTSYRLQNIMEIQNSIASNESILQYLNEEPANETLYRQYVDFQEMTAILNGFYTNRDIRQISLYVNGNKLYANQYADFYPLHELESSPVYAEVFSSPGRCVWSMETGPAGPAVLTCYRAIINIRNYEQIAGVSTIQMAEEILYQCLTESAIDGAQTIMLVHNENGLILSHADKSAIGTPFSRELFAQLQASPNSFIQQTKQDVPTYFLIKGLDNVPWSIVIEFPSHLVIRQSRFFNSAVSIILIIAILIAGLLLVLFTTELSRQQTIFRIQKINDAIAELGIHDVITPKHAIHRLDRQVSSMLSLIQNQIDELYANELRLRDERLHALQAQINPHFLYNTLDTMHWMALEHGAADISHMLDLLATYFRMSLNKGKDIVTIADEIQLVQAYANIQMIRFDHSFDFLCSVEQGAEKCLIPKLTLQPIVENSINHGIRNVQDRRGRVSISVTCSSEAVHITITDNGVGLEEETYRNILSALNSRQETRGDHYGLYNVNERLSLFSGKHHSFAFVSQPGNGTTTTIRLSKTYPTDQ